MSDSIPPSNRSDLCFYQMSDEEIIRTKKLHRLLVSEFLTIQEKKHLILAIEDYCADDGEFVESVDDDEVEMCIAIAVDDGYTPFPESPAVSTLASDQNAA